jgi:hypothetical protein
MSYPLSYICKALLQGFLDTRKHGRDGELFRMILDSTGRPFAAATPTVGEVARTSPISSTGRFLFYQEHPDEWVSKYGLAWYRKIANDPQVYASLDILYSAVVSLWHSASGSLPTLEEWMALQESLAFLPQSLQMAVMSQAVNVATPQILPPKNPTPIELQATEFARFVIDDFLGRNIGDDADIVGRNFGRVLEQTLSCIEDGKSIQEIDWQRIKDGQWAGKWGITDILWRYPDFFDFDSDNRLILRQFIGGPAIIPIPPKKMILTTFDPRYENYHGNSMLRSLSYAMDFKWNSEGSCAISEERFGMPTAIGWVDTDRSSTTIDVMKTNLEGLQRGQSLVMNQDASGHIEDVSFLETARNGGSSGYDLTIQRNNRSVSKVLLGSALALEEGDNGSYSLAALTAAPNFRRKVARLVKILNWTHTTQTLAWLTWFNFPAGTRSPILEIRLPQTWDAESASKPDDEKKAIAPSARQESEQDDEEEFSYKRQ